MQAQNGGSTVSSPLSSHTHVYVPRHKRYNIRMPPQSGPPGQKMNLGSAWNSLRKRANAVGSIFALFSFLVVGGAVSGYYWAKAHTPKPQTKEPAISTLSQDEINKLNQVGANLGTAGQTLNIGANSLFRGKVDVGGNLTIGGQLNANGPVTLSSLNITGSTAATGLIVGSDLKVTGISTFDKGISVNGLAAINGGLNVTGTASINALNAATIAVRTISISGPLTIGHLATQGPAPGIVGGTVGSGGTVSISGNDTAGTININTGTGPGGVLASVTFRAAYPGAVHVQITPLSGGAASAGAYVTRTGGGFQIHANTPPSGQTLSFDYLVIQ
jgi:hypothetical protein